MPLLDIQRLQLDQDAKRALLLFLQARLDAEMILTRGFTLTGAHPKRLTNSTWLICPLPDVFTSEKSLGNS